VRRQRGLVDQLCEIDLATASMSLAGEGLRFLVLVFVLGLNLLLLLCGLMLLKACGSRVLLFVRGHGVPLLRNLDHLLLQEGIARVRDTAGVPAVFGTPRLPRTDAAPKLTVWGEWGSNQCRVRLSLRNCRACGSRATPWNNFTGLRCSNEFACPGRSATRSRSSRHALRGVLAACPGCGAARSSADKLTQSAQT
jgi:hypothetical protein